MRTLKKTLCMVLALVMMLGLCAFGTSAAFSDADKVTYKEAVDVLTGIGVIKGMGDAANTFNPDGTLTRAQACTIITKLMGGDGISAKSTFTDMAGAAWAESYVAFCQAKGIVGGYGDGRFGPNDTLTGSQWGRMVLLAAGFDAKTNGFESGNANWEIGVAKTVKDKGLAARISGFNGTQPITRDAACEMAFQGMQKSPDGKDTYKVGNVTFDNLNDAAIYAALVSGTPVPVEAEDSLMATNFKGLKRIDGADALGRTTAGWTYNAKNNNLVKDTVVIQNATAAASYSLTVNGLNLLGTGSLGAYNTANTEENFVKGLNKALGLTGTKKLAAAGNMAVYLNGEEFDVDDSTNATDVAISDEIEIYLDQDGEIAKVVIVRYQAVVIGKTTKLSTTSANGLIGTPAEGSTTAMTVAGKTIYDKLFVGNVFAEDDYALVAVANIKDADGNPTSYWTVADAKAVETVEGTASKVDVSSQNVTLGGKTYAKSGISNSAIATDLGSKNIASLANFNYANTYILHLAQDGTYIAIEKKTDKADTSVVYAVAKYTKQVETGDTAYGNGWAPLYYVQCVNLDGEVVSYQVKKAAYDSFSAGLKKVTIASDKDSGNALVATTYYNYADLDTVAASTSAAAMSGNTAVETYTTSLTDSGNKFYLNAGQKVIFLDTTNGTLSGLKVTVKTGKTAIKSGLTYNVYGTGSGAAGNTNFNVQAIFVSGAATAESSGTGLIFAKTGTSTTSVAAKKPDGTEGGIAYAQNVWIDGEAKEIYTSAAKIGEGADGTFKAYKYTIDDVTGLYKLGDAYESVKSGVVSNNNGGIVDIGSGAHEADLDLSKATLVNTLSPIFQAADYEKCATTVADLDGETVTVVFSVNNNIWTPTVVYITAAPTT